MHVGCQKDKNECTGKKNYSYILNVECIQSISCIGSMFPTRLLYCLETGERRKDG